jgi:hypothetical protein
MLALLVLLAVPAVAVANPDAVIRDCAEDGDLDRKYSNADLKAAEDALPSDLDEYSDCREVIAGAVTGGSDKGGGRSPEPTGAAAAKAERSARQGDAAALDRLARSGGRPKLSVGGKTVEPGSNGLFDLASASNGVPLPLVLALIALAALAVAGAAYGLRRRVPALARLPLPRIDLSRVPLPRFRR